MNMRQALLLKLNGAHQGKILSNIAIFYLFDLDPDSLTKKSGNQIRPIRRCLSRKEFSLDFRPLWIGCHGKEKVWFATEVCDSQGILVKLKHVMGTPKIG